MLWFREWKGRGKGRGKKGRWGGNKWGSSFVLHLGSGGSKEKKTPKVFERRIIIHGNIIMLFPNDTSIGSFASSEVENQSFFDLCGILCSFFLSLFSFVFLLFSLLSFSLSLFNNLFIKLKVCLQGNKLGESQCSFPPASIHPPFPMCPHVPWHVSRTSLLPLFRGKDGKGGARRSSIRLPRLQ